MIALPGGGNKLPVQSSGERNRVFQLSVGETSCFTIETQWGEVTAYGRLARSRHADCSSPRHHPDQYHGAVMDKNQIFSITLLAAVALFVFFFGRGAGASDRIGSDEARELVANGAQLVDVRTPGEYGSAHIDGAVNIPVQDLDSRFAELSQNTPVVVYCRSGNRSATAASMLRANGFEEVHDLGAMSAW